MIRPALAWLPSCRVCRRPSADQHGTDCKLIDFAQGANMLVMHLAIAAGASPALHASPAEVGRIAQDAGVGGLVLSHIGQFDLDAAIADMKKAPPAH